MGRLCKNGFYMCKNGFYSTHCARLKWKGGLLHFIAVNVYDKYSGSKKFTTRLYHISRCEATPGTNWSSGWTDRLFTIMLIQINSGVNLDWALCITPAVSLAVAPPLGGLNGSRCLDIGRILGPRSR